MRKNGRTAAGKQRWKCTDCSLTTTVRREDLVDQAVFSSFLDYIAGKNSIEQLGTAGGSSRSTLYRQFLWCWQVPIPPPPITGEVHQQLFLDGKRIAYGWTLLTAINQAGFVVAWAWASGESTAAYRALLQHLAPPLVVTVDGAQGALKAIKDTWESQDNVRVQRCLLHIHRNNLRDLTSRPKTQAGKALLGLSKRLLRITNLDEATLWQQLVGDFYQLYGKWLKERTVARQDPQEALRRGRSWWYTHERDRRVYYRLVRLMKEQTLWVYLTTTPETGLHRTTNIVESLNARIDAICYYHRGLSEAHLLSAIQWYLHSRTETPQKPGQIFKDWDSQGRPPARILPRKTRPKPKSDGPQKWGTGLSAEEGLWARKGWAGRSHT